MRASDSTKAAGHDPEQMGPLAPLAATRRSARPAISSSMDPIAARSFGFAQARHLLLRAGFGGTPEQVRTVASWGPERAVDHLLNYEDIPYDPVEPDAFDKDLIRPPSAEERATVARARRAGDQEVAARLLAMRQEAERRDRAQIRDVQAWWLKRMIESPRPLEEKMTLFWHGHFATSYRTVEDSYHMFAQNQLFRSHALGGYGDLMFRIIRDPAMIAYLDNNDSRRGRPNENLARELMELFSLGVGGYTEKDIKEGARALTGYTFEDDEFVFQRGNHDAGKKTILGRAGDHDGDDFVRIILEQPACSRFMAAKLYRFFVADHPTGREHIDGAAREVIRLMAGVLTRSEYQLKPVLRRLFLSRHFYEPAVMGEQIKSPVDLVVGAVRTLNAPVRDLNVLLDAMSLMGQNLFHPPSVKGWDGGRAWINTATFFIRQNILCFLLTGRTPRGYDALARSERFEPRPLLASLSGAAGSDDAERLVDALLEFTIGTASTPHRGTLLSYVEEKGGTLDAETATGLLLLITAMPEYQLC